MKERPTTFKFKSFEISDSLSAMKIGTDGVLLGAWAFEKAPNSVLDVGTGTGLIALMLAQRFPKSKITGIEIDPMAANEALRNVEQSPWKDRIKIICGDYLSLRLQPVDAIVSNPPFFSTGELSPTPSRACARHERKLSIDLLIMHSSSLLNPDGHLALIAPFERLDDIIYRGAINHLDAMRITKIKPKPNTNTIRVLVEFKKGLSSTYNEEYMYIRNNDGKLTDEYKQLTSDFYL